ncbi:hypothetical protein KQI82_12460 [Oscillibacter sp. MSJ-2]|uniref:DZANK-type domain-containing protein n=1 Tax=Dysosmobacter acutus TaxID=2841504 RepID=A0ABS6F8A4_9FIRM|nr:hypothetical protein [Dysosmobacter acutus]MBU5626524.1 hypothetical protein [Dysosmobacter acutus]MBU5627722.1 hypothetical protein [Dysosmobacter acutus]
MTEIEKAVIAFERMAGSGICTESDKVALAALREKQEREKGCDFCRKELDDYPYINACGDCDSSGTVYTPAFCPICGRPLSET